MLMHTAMAAVTGGGTERDQWGDIIEIPEVVEPFYGEFVPASSSEPDPGTGQFVETEFRVLLPRHIEPPATAKIRVFGTDYPLDGAPMPILVRGQIHHWEARVKRLTSP